MVENGLYEHWWNQPGECDQTMEENHQRFWRKILSMITETCLDQIVVLDFGCNQGGFLRYLYHHRPFKHGIGVDLAKGAVRIANERKANLPIQYYATADLSAFNRQVDLAISTSVLYLIEDLNQHATQIKQVLKPGGVYYASYTDYAQNPSLPAIREKINAYGASKMCEHKLTEIAEAFASEGFNIGVRRLPVDDFIPVEGDDPFFNVIEDRLLFEYEQSYVFRFSLQ
jgi:SAM-dependent methyltransferase